MKSFRAGLNYANVMATIAVFAALGTGGAYAANQIGSDGIMDESLTDVDIQDGSLNAAIAPGAVTTAKLAPNSVLGSTIGDGTIAKADLGLNAVDSARVENNSVQSQDVSDNTLTGTDVADNSIGGQDVTESLTGSDVASDSLYGSDINESTLSKVPSAARADTAGDAYLATWGQQRTLWNNQTWHQQVAVDLPAGSFAITAKVQGIGNIHEHMPAECRVRLGNVVLDQAIDRIHQYDETNANLLGIGSLPAPGKAIVDCRRWNTGDHDGYIASSRIMAVKVANVH